MVEERGSERGTATNLVMEGGSVEDNQVTAGPAALPAVQAVVLTAPHRAVGSPGAKDEISPGAESVVGRMTGSNAPRVRATATLMRTVLEVWSVEETIAGCIFCQPHLRMTAVRLLEELTVVNTQLRPARSAPMTLVTEVMERLGVMGNVPGNKEDAFVNTSMIGNQLIPVQM